MITITSMTNTCTKCDGAGELKCCECGQFRDCPDCDGEGTVEIDAWAIPEKHKNYDELRALQSDADKCHNDHAKLIALNPRAKDSYDSQLATALAEINSKATALL